MRHSTSGRNRAFISYSHRDQGHLERLRVYLEAAGVETLEVWDDNMILPGDEWRREIAQAIESASVAILLVSADYLASKFIKERELPPLLAAAKKRGTRILSVILAPVPRTFHQSELANYQAVNSPARPLIGLDQVYQEEIWARLSDLVYEALHPEERETIIQKLDPPDAEARLAELVRQFTESLQQQNWGEALNTYRKAQAFLSTPEVSASAGSLPSKEYFEQRVGIDQLLTILPRLNAPLVADPDLPTLESGASFPDQLALEAFHYPLSCPEQSLPFLHTFLATRHQMPSREELRQGMGEDAALVLLLMGQRAQAAEVWEEQQHQDPANSHLAHKLGILYYCWARQANTPGQAAAHWRAAIGNWAQAVVDETFWAEWGQKRSAASGERLTDHLPAVREKVISRLAESLVQPPELLLMWQSELAAARLLKKAGGLPVAGAHPGQLVCGPLMISALHLENALAQFVAQGQLTLSSLTQAFEKREPSPAFLRCSFSQLRFAVLLLEQDRPIEALAVLERTDYSQCSLLCHAQQDRPHTPKVYCLSCHLFAQVNFAYLHFPEKDRERIFLDDAREIMLAAHLAASRHIFASPEPLLADATIHWQAAVELAKLTSAREERLKEVQSSIGEMALNHARALLQRAHKEKEDKDFSWFEEIEHLSAKTVEVVGQNKSLSYVLADALALRGVRRSNLLNDVVSAEADLRRAFEMKPFSPYILHQFLVALRQVALYTQKDEEALSAADRLAKAEGLLEEARQLAVQGLKDTPGQEDLLQERQEIEKALIEIKIDRAHYEKETQQKAPLALRYLQEARQITERCLEVEPHDEKLREQLQKIEALIWQWTLWVDVPRDDGVLEKVRRLEQQLWKEPTNERLRRQLLTELILCSTQLHATGQRTRAMNEIEQRLNLFAEGSKERGKLRSQLDFLREGYLAQELLQKTRLNYGEAVVEVGQAFTIPFRGGFTIRLDIPGNLAMIYATLPSALTRGNKELLSTLLQAFHRIPFHKPCWIENRIRLVAHLPVALLDDKMLHFLIRLTLHYLVIEPEDVVSPQQLEESLMLIYEVLASDLEMEPLLEHMQDYASIPDLCAEARITCNDLGDGSYTLQRTPTSPHVSAGFHLTPYFSIPLEKVSGGQEATYRDLAALNSTLTLCRATVNPEQRVTFSCELPRLNAVWLASALEALESAAAEYGKPLG